MTTLSDLLPGYVIRDSEGSIDDDLTLAKFASELVKFKAERETEEATIASAVCDVFDEFRGTRLNMPAVISFTLHRMNARPENYKVLSERIGAYIRSNAQGDKSEDGSVERPDSLFTVEKGKDGGCRRRCDTPPKPAKK
jgi:hypothetical protein